MKRILENPLIPCIGEINNQSITDQNQNDRNLFQMLPDDCILAIFSNFLVKDLGSMALVCKVFNRIQNKPILWERIANLFHYTITLDKDLKLQIRDAKIKLELGEVDLQQKCITLNDKFKPFWAESYEFLKKALAYFPKNYFFSFDIQANIGPFQTFGYYDKETPKIIQPDSDELDEIKEILKNRKEIHMLANCEGAAVEDNHLILCKYKPIFMPMPKGGR